MGIHAGLPAAFCVLPGVITGIGGGLVRGARVDRAHRRAARRVDLEGLGVAARNRSAGARVHEQDTA